MLMTVDASKVSCAGGYNSGPVFTKFAAAVAA